MPAHSIYIPAPSVLLQQGVPAVQTGSLSVSGNITSYSVFTDGGPTICQSIASFGPLTGTSGRFSDALRTDTSISAYQGNIGGPLAAQSLRLVGALVGTSAAFTDALKGTGATFSGQLNANAGLLVDSGITIRSGNTSYTSPSSQKISGPALSITVGNATGGDKGIGSINAQALYVNNVAVGSSSVTIGASVTDVGTAGSTGSGTAASAVNHIHKYEAATVRFQNSGDNDKKIQMGASITADTASATTPSGFHAKSISFASTFATTPVVVSGGDINGGFPGAVASPTTSGYTQYIWSVSGEAFGRQFQYLAIG